MVRGFAVFVAGYAMNALLWGVVLRFPALVVASAAAVLVCVLVATRRP